MRPVRRREPDLSDRLDAIYDQIKLLQAGIRAKVEHPFCVLKRQFGYMKTRHRGLMKNTAQIATLFALGNLWTARRALRKAGRSTSQHILNADTVQQVKGQRSENELSGPSFICGP
jgi:hypothetical protein